MKYWEEEESINSLKAMFIGLSIFIGTMVGTTYFIEKQVFEATGMTIAEVSKQSAAPNLGLTGDIFCIFIIIMYAVSSSMFFYGKYRHRELHRHK